MTLHINSMEVLQKQTSELTQTHRCVGVLDAMPVILHSWGVTKPRVIVLTCAFNVKVLYGHLKTFGNSSVRLLLWDRPLWPRTTTKSKVLPFPAGQFYLQWNSEMGKPEFFTTLLYMDARILKTTKKNPCRLPRGFWEAPVTAQLNGHLTGDHINSNPHSSAHLMCGVLCNKHLRKESSQLIPALQICCPERDT